MNCPFPASVKVVCAYHFTFYPIPEVSLLCFLLPPLTYHQWTSRNPLMAPPLILTCKIRCYTAILWSISQCIEILLPSNCRQFGSNKLTKNSQQVWMFLTLALRKHKSSEDSVPQKAPSRDYRCVSWIFLTIAEGLWEAQGCCPSAIPAGPPKGRYCLEVRLECTGVNAVKSTWDP